MQPIDLIKTYAYGKRKDLVSEKEEIKLNNIIKRYKKMINLNNFTTEEVKEHNPNLP